MENLRLVNAKNTWLLPLFSKDESSTKPPVRPPVIISSHLQNLLFQKLLDLLTVRVSKYPWRHFLHKLPDSAKTLLFKYVPELSQKTSSHIFSIYLVPIHAILVQVYVFQMVIE